MMVETRKKHAACRGFMTDRGGNFGMMTAILLPVLLASAGVAMDLAKLVQVKSALQDAADSAALSAASALASKDITDAEAIALAKQFMAAQFRNTSLNGSLPTEEEEESAKDLAEGALASIERTKDESGLNKAFEVKVSGHYDVPMNAFTRLLGYDTVRVSVASTSESTQASGNALSMYLVLDRSGSMSFVTDTRDTSQSSCVNYTSANWGNKDVQKGKQGYIAPSSPCYVKKIAALKTASTVMLDMLNEADPDRKFVRLGAVSYNDSTQTPSSITWGTSGAASYVNALPSVPTGGTNASGAMKVAYDALKRASTTEATAHTAKGNRDFQRFILLMTDGEMTGSSSSWNSTIDNQVRNYCDQAKNDDIKIFSVAFMAPNRGKSLLGYCASATDYYFEPEDMGDLVSAFRKIGQKAADLTTRLTN